MPKNMTMSDQARKILRHQPHLNVQQIVSTAKQEGHRVSEAIASRIFYERKREVRESHERRSAAAKSRVAKAAKRVANGAKAGYPALEELLAAFRTIRRLGGIEETKKLMESLRTALE